MRYTDLLTLLGEKDERPGHVFEQIIQEWYESFLARDSAAIDGGALGGRHSIPMARAVDAGTVHAFEPLDTNRRRLMARLERTGLSNVVVHDVALSNTSGRMPFFHVFGAPGYSGLRRQDTYADHIDPGAVVKVDVMCVTLDDMAPDLGGPIRFIKLDLEGGEFDALRGGSALIGQHRPVIVFESALSKAGALYGYTRDEFFDWFDEQALTLFTPFGDPVTRAAWDAEDQPFYTWAFPDERVETHREQLVEARRSALSLLDLPDVTGG